MDPSQDPPNGAATSDANEAPKEMMHSSAITKADEALKKLDIRDLLVGRGQKSKEQPKDMSTHKFWATQPVPHFDDASSSSAPDGPIKPEDLDKVPKDPYPLLEGFEWVTVDINDKKEVDDVYNLLFNNYVEDDEAMFRFKYSSSFLDWALKPPGWRKEWHVGIRVTSSRKLVAFISGVPVTLRVRSKLVNCSEINFLCVHKKLRSKRLAPILIGEITRRCHLAGIWQAIYTAGIMLPTPVSTCRYYHRSLDWQKLYDVGFSPLPPGSTKQRQIMKFKLPERTATPGLRPMEMKDIPAVGELLKRYLDRTDMAQEFSEEELGHWILNNDTSSPDQIVWAYVAEAAGRIMDFISFYELASTIINHDKHKDIRAAYLFYYATETAFEGDGKDQAALKKRLNVLVNDALILAKKANFDVFNALSLLDNPLFLQEQKFGPGDGRLHYYLYNYRTAPIAGGIDAKADLDLNRMNGVGVVML